MKKLYLHVGPHKTGTTTLQGTFCHYRNDLKQHGIDYFPGSNHTIFYKAFSDCLESYHQYYRGWRRSVNQDAERAKIREQLYKLNEDTIVVSAEDISLLSENALKEMKGFLISECGIDQITVVAYIRKPFDYLLSSIQQFIKPGMTDLDDITRNHYKKYSLQGCPNFVGGAQEILSELYLPIPRKLINSFGKENVILDSFEQSIKKGISQSLLEHIGLDSHIRLKDVSGNEGISHEACLLLADLNNTFPLLDKNNLINKFRNRNNNIVMALRCIPGRKAKLILPGMIDLKVINEIIDKENKFLGAEVFSEVTQKNINELYSKDDYFNFSDITKEYLSMHYRIREFNNNRDVIKSIFKKKFIFKYYFYSILGYI